MIDSIPNEPHRRYDILQTCSELIASLKPEDQKWIMAALTEDFGKPEQGKSTTFRPSATRSYGRKKAWKG